MVERSTKKALSLNDVSIWISTESGKTRIGMIQTVKVNVAIDQQILHEAGSNGNPADRIFLKKTVNGSFDRTLVDVTVLKSLWNSFDDKPVEFDLSGIAISDNGSDRDFLVKGCAISAFPLDLSLDAATTQALEFQALSFEWVN